MVPVMRVARPTDRLEAVVAFYRDLGFAELARFEDHDGFDGVILGNEQAPYHLEFTHQRGHRVGDAPNKDHLLAFYLPERREWAARVATIEAKGHKPVKSWNPYWDRQGRTYQDPDGYRVVLQNAPWTK